MGTAGILDSTNALYGLLSQPRGVAVDNNGNIYIADYTNSLTREAVPTSTGYSLFSFYGSGSSRHAPNIPTGTGQPSVPARIRITTNNATSVAVDAGNNIYYALAGDSRVVVISADHGSVYIVGGGGYADTGLNYSSANLANIETPTSPVWLLTLKAWSIPLIARASCASLSAPLTASLSTKSE